ncbi:hypothetical protein B0H17DRAFT_1206800 [Mycena rosella]|uniref:Uncharacterized protein n=1 Tax=Mycena rosella TaxID=1033263 RepID=A0AAD7D4J6_MYCRO|nr:hypothetical protein B0H17DRAFT_1206800 [Mycena rosella]
MTLLCSPSTTIFVPAFIVANKTVVAAGLIVVLEVEHTARWPNTGLMTSLRKSSTPD